MSKDEELEELLEQMAAHEPEATSDESDDEDGSAIAWRIAYSTYRN